MTGYKKEPEEGGLKQAVAPIQSPAEAQKAAQLQKQAQGAFVTQFLGGLEHKKTGLLNTDNILTTPPADKTFDNLKNATQPEKPVEPKAVQAPAAIIAPTAPRQQTGQILTNKEYVQNGIAAIDHLTTLTEQVVLPLETKNFVLGKLNDLKTEMQTLSTLPELELNSQKVQTRLKSIYQTQVFVLTSIYSCSEKSTTNEARFAVIAQNIDAGKQELENFKPMLQANPKTKGYASGIESATKELSDMQKQMKKEHDAMNSDYRKAVDALANGDEKTSQKLYADSLNHFDNFSKLEAKATALEKKLGTEMQAFETKMAPIIKEAVARDTAQKQGMAIDMCDKTLEAFEANLRTNKGAGDPTLLEMRKNWKSELTDMRSRLQGAKPEDLPGLLKEFSDMFTNFQVASAEASTRNQLAGITSPRGSLQFLRGSVWEDRITSVNADLKNATTPEQREAALKRHENLSIDLQYAVPSLSMLNGCAQALINSGDKSNRATLEQLTLINQKIRKGDVALAKIVSEPNAMKTFSFLTDQYAKNFSNCPDVSLVMRGRIQGLARTWNEGKNAHYDWVNKNGTVDYAVFLSQSLKMVADKLHDDISKLGTKDTTVLWVRNLARSVEGKEWVSLESNANGFSIAANTLYSRLLRKDGAAVDAELNGKHFDQLMLYMGTAFDYVAGETGLSKSQKATVLGDSISGLTAGANMLASVTDKASYTKYKHQFVSGAFAGFESKMNYENTNTFVQAGVDTAMQAGPPILTLLSLLTLQPEGVAAASAWSAGLRFAGEKAILYFQAQALYDMGRTGYNTYTTGKFSGEDAWRLGVDATMVFGGSLGKVAQEGSTAARIASKAGSIMMGTDMVKNSGTLIYDIVQNRGDSERIMNDVSSIAVNLVFLGHMYKGATGKQLDMPTLSREVNKIPQDVMNYFAVGRAKAEVGAGGLVPASARPVETATSKSAIVPETAPAEGVVLGKEFDRRADLLNQIGGAKKTDGKAKITPIEKGTETKATAPKTEIAKKTTAPEPAVKTETKITAKVETETKTPVAESKVRIAASRENPHEAQTPVEKAAPKTKRIGTDIPESETTDRNRTGTRPRAPVTETEIPIEQKIIDLAGKLKTSPEMRKPYEDMVKSPEWRKLTPQQKFTELRRMQAARIIYDGVMSGEMLPQAPKGERSTTLSTSGPMTYIDYNGRFFEEAATVLGPTQVKTVGEGKLQVTTPSGDTIIWEVGRIKNSEGKGGLLWNIDKNGWEFKSADALTKLGYVRDAKGTWQAMQLHTSEQQSAFARKCLNEANVPKGEGAKIYIGSGLEVPKGETLNEMRDLTVIARKALGNLEKSYSPDFARKYTGVKFLFVDGVTMDRILPPGKGGRTAGLHIVDATGKDPPVIMIRYEPSKGLDIPRISGLLVHEFMHEATPYSREELSFASRFVLDGAVRTRATGGKVIGIDTEISPQSKAVLDKAVNKEPVDKNELKAALGEVRNKLDLKEMTVHPDPSKKYASDNKVLDIYEESKQVKTALGELRNKLRLEKASDPTILQNYKEQAALAQKYPNLNKVFQGMHEGLTEYFTGKATGRKSTGYTNEVARIEEFSKFLGKNGDEILFKALTSGDYTPIIKGLEKYYNGKGLNSELAVTNKLKVFEQTQGNALGAASKEGGPPHDENEPGTARVEPEPVAKAPVLTDQMIKGFWDELKIHNASLHSQGIASMMPNVDYETFRERALVPGTREANYCEGKAKELESGNAVTAPKPYTEIKQGEAAGLKAKTQTEETDPMLTAWDAMNTMRRARGDPPIKLSEFLTEVADNKNAAAAIPKEKSVPVARPETEISPNEAAGKGGAQVQTPAATSAEIATRIGPETFDKMFQGSVEGAKAPENTNAWARQSEVYGSDRRYQLPTDVAKGLRTLSDLTEVPRNEFYDTVAPKFGEAQDRYINWQNVMETETSDLRRIDDAVARGLDSKTGMYRVKNADGSTKFLHPDDVQAKKAEAENRIDAAEGKYRKSVESAFDTLQKEGLTKDQILKAFNAPKKSGGEHAPAQKKVNKETATVEKPSSEETAPVQIGDLKNSTPKELANLLSKPEHRTNAANELADRIGSEGVRTEDLLPDIFDAIHKNGDLASDKSVSDLLRKINRKLERDSRYSQTENNLVEASLPYLEKNPDAKVIASIINSLDPVKDSRGEFVQAPDLDAGKIDARSLVDTLSRTDGINREAILQVVKYLPELTTTGVEFEGKNIHLNDFADMLKNDGRFEYNGHMQFVEMKLFTKEQIASFKKNYEIDPSARKTWNESTIKDMTLEEYTHLVKDKGSGNLLVHAMTPDENLQTKIFESGHLIGRGIYEERTNNGIKTNRISTPYVHTVVNGAAVDISDIAIVLPLEAAMENGHGFAYDPLMNSKTKADSPLMGLSDDPLHKSHEVDLDLGVVLMPKSKKAQYEKTFSDLEAAGHEKPRVYYYEGKNLAEGLENFRKETGITENPQKKVRISAAPKPARAIFANAVGSYGSDLIQGRSFEALAITSK
ncbi:Uncharacterised protein [Candidatus Gugararchaeum adminiculabundum]|nr:Uncharacterised protein [Candidatus Gugararchaeum adminiculabundum]